MVRQPIRTLPTTCTTCTPPCLGRAAGYLRFSEIFGKYFARRRFPTTTGPQICKNLEKARAPRLVRRAAFPPERAICARFYRADCPRCACLYRAELRALLSRGPPTMCVLLARALRPQDGKCRRANPTGPENPEVGGAISRGGRAPRGRSVRQDFGKMN